MLVAEQVHVRHIPDDAAIQTAVSPSAFERLADAATIVTDPSRVASLAALIQRMPAAENADATPDCRWSAKLCTRDGEVLRTIYVDRFGRRAVIDGRNASVLATPVVRALAHALRQARRQT